MCSTPPLPTTNQQQTPMMMTKQRPLRFVCWLLLLAAAGLASAGRPSRALMQPAEANKPSSSLAQTVHQCLWSPAASPAAPAASATAEATATATGDGSSTATAVAAAQAGRPAGAASAPASTAPDGGPRCSLNPSSFFSLPAPQQAGERLLLQVTAMRYLCLNHTTDAACTSDQANWCVWQEDKARCQLYFSDADMVHFLLWSNIKLACDGSLVAKLVDCSFGVSTEQCAAQPGCEWAEAACYPSGYAVTKPKSLAKLKRQVHVADPEVWGTCAGADLYARYSSICSHTTAEACTADPAGCTFLPEFESEIASNPLNFTKPCILSSARFPLESVFLDPGSSSPFTASLLDAQRGCTAAATEASCRRNTTAFTDALTAAAASWGAGLANSSVAATVNGSAGEHNAPPELGATSWSDPSWSAAWQPQAGDSQPGPAASVPSPGTAAAASAAASAVAIAAARPPTPQPPADAGAGGPLSSTATSSTIAAAPSPPAIVASPAANAAASAAAADVASPFKPIILSSSGLAQQPIQLSELAWPHSVVLGVAEFAEGACTLPSTCRAACVSLVALRVKQTVCIARGVPHRQGQPFAPGRFATAADDKWDLPIVAGG